MTSIQKINTVSFGSLGHSKDRYERRTNVDTLPKTNIGCGSGVERYLTPQEQYIDSRLKEQEQNLKKAIEKQNALIGSSLVAVVNYLNGNSDANTTRDLIQKKLIKKDEKRRIEI